MHHEMHFVDSLVNMPVATEPIFVRLRERLMTEHGSDAFDDKDVHHSAALVIMLRSRGESSFSE